MKSKEEMIEIIRLKICEGLNVNSKIHSYGYIAKDALEALCGALPDVKNLRERYDSMGLLSEYRSTPEVQQNINDIYNQLKQWGK